MALQYYILCKKMYENNIILMQEMIHNFEIILNESNNIVHNLPNNLNTYASNANSHIFFLNSKLEGLNIAKSNCEKIINKLCQHNYVKDSIDITPEKSVNVQYCNICETTLSYDM